MKKLTVKDCDIRYLEVRDRVGYDAMLTASWQSVKVELTFKLPDTSHIRVPYVPCIGADVAHLYIDQEIQLRSKFKDEWLRNNMDRLKQEVVDLLNSKLETVFNKLKDE